MRKMVSPDPESNASNLEYAVIYIPKRSRNRFSANRVEIKLCAADALHKADSKNKYFAKVHIARLPEMLDLLSIEGHPNFGKKVRPPQFQLMSF